MNIGFGTGAQLEKAADNPGAHEAESGDQHRCNGSDQINAPTDVPYKDTADCEHASREAPPRALVEQHANPRDILDLSHGYQVTHPLPRDVTPAR